MKAKAFIRVITYIGATLLATAVILLLLAVIKVPVENPGETGEKPEAVKNQPDDQKTNMDDQSSQPGPSRTAGENPSAPGSPSSEKQPAGNAGVQSQTPAPSPAPAPAPQPTSPPPPEEPRQSALDVLIDTVQDVLPEGVL